MPFEEYKDLVATAASVTTIAQLFSPIFLCKKIVQTGSCKGSDPMPFIGGLAMSVLFLKYGFIIKDPAMIPVNIFGLVLNLGYSACYYMYSTEKEKQDFFAVLGKAVALVAVIIGYTMWEKEEHVEFRYGMITTVIMLTLIASPLFSLGEIIKTKSCEGLPFPLIVSGTAVSFLWLLYGIIIENVFMQVQNVVGLALSITQLSLFVIYPSSVPVKDAEEKKKS